LSLVYLQAKDAVQLELEENVKDLEKLVKGCIKGINKLTDSIEKAGPGDDVVELEAKLELANSDLREARTSLKSAKEALKEYLQQIEENSAGKSF